MHTEEQLWEKSFQTKPRLSPVEAYRSAVLRSRLTGLRYLSSEYLLRRATHSSTKQESIAWQSVWALMVFVEHQRRFPRQGELYPYLHNILDESKLLEDLHLPPIDLTKPIDAPGEAQKSLLEELVADRLTFSRQLDRTRDFLDRLKAVLKHLQGSPDPSLSGEDLEFLSSQVRDLQEDLGSS